MDQGFPMAKTVPYSTSVTSKLGNIILVKLNPKRFIG